MSQRAAGTEAGRPRRSQVSEETGQRKKMWLQVSVSLHGSQESEGAHPLKRKLARELRRFAERQLGSNQPKDDIHPHFSACGWNSLCLSTIPFAQALGWKKKHPGCRELNSAPRSQNAVCIFI